MKHMVSRLALSAMAMVGFTFAAFGATTIYVDGSSEAEPSAPYGEATPFKTIADAVAYAAALESDESFPVEIVVKTGTYTETGMTLAKPITVRGETGDCTDVIIDDEVSGSRAFRIENDDAKIANLTIQGKGIQVDSGGHVYMTAGTVTNCVITGGRASGNKAVGGNVYMTGGFLLDSEITHGVIQNQYGGDKLAYGGGIAVTGGTISGCTIAFNNTAQAAGVVGGVYAYGSTVVITNCMIFGNREDSTSVHECCGIYARTCAKVCDTVICDNGDSLAKEIKGSAGYFHNCGTYYPEFVGAGDCYVIDPDVVFPPVDVYVDSTSANPKAPYEDRLTAAKSITDAMASIPDGQAAVVHVAPGTYEETGFVLSGRIRIVGEGGDRSQVKIVSSGGRAFNLSNKGAMVANLTICGEGANGGSGGHVLMSAGMVTNCVVTGGRTNGNSAHGGNVYMSGGTLVDCELTEGKAVSNHGSYNSFGGGLAATGGTILGCKIANNSTGGQCGLVGGVYLSGSSVVMSNCVITGNKETNTHTGFHKCCGIYVTGSPQIYDTAIFGNGASLAQEIFDYGSVAACFHHCATLYPEFLGAGDCYEVNPDDYFPPVELYVDSESTGAAAPYADWTTAATGIAEALASLPSGQAAIVHVAPGTYGDEYDLALDGRISIVGEGGDREKVIVSSATVVQGRRAFILSNAGATLANLTVVNMGVEVSAGLVTNCVITGATSGNKSRGANVCLKGGTLIDCAITRGKCSSDSNSGGSPAHAFGGGVYASGGRIVSCWIFNNRASDICGYGGGVYLDGSAVLSNSTVACNSEESGGRACGVYMASSSATAVGCLICGNGHDEASNFGTANRDRFVNCSSGPLEDVVACDIFVDAKSTTAAAPYGTWATAASNLTQALSVPAGEGMTRIFVRPGNYNDNSMALDRPVMIMGTGAKPSDVVITDSVAGKRAFALSHAAALLSNLTIEGSGFYNIGNGGHVFMSVGAIQDCIIRGGEVGRTGGNGNSGGNLHMSGGHVWRCQLLGGAVTGGSGGGLYAKGGVIESCLLCGNRALGNAASSAGAYLGRGVMNRGAQMINCTVVANASSAGTLPVGVGVDDQTHWDAADRVKVLNTVVFGNGDSLVGEIGAVSNRFFNCATGFANDADVNGRVIDASAFRNFVSAVSGGSVIGLRPAAGGGLCNAGASVETCQAAGATSGTDLLGKSRVSGKRIDIGALEAPNACSYILFR